MKYFCFSFRGHIRTRSIRALVASCGKIKNFNEICRMTPDNLFTERKKDETPPINRSIIIMLIVVVVVAAAINLVDIIIVIIFF